MAEEWKFVFRFQHCKHKPQLVLLLQVLKTQEDKRYCAFCLLLGPASVRPQYSWWPQKLQSFCLLCPQFPYFSTFIPFLCSSDWFILNNLFSSSQIHSASYSSLDSIEANFLFHSLNPSVPEFSFYYFYLLNFSFCSCIVLLILLSHILYFLVAHWVSLKQLFWISCLTYYRSPLLESQLPKNYCFPLVVSGFCDFLCVFLEVLHCCLYT